MIIRNTLTLYWCLVSELVLSQFTTGLRLSSFQGLFKVLQCEVKAYFISGIGECLTHGSALFSALYIFVLPCAWFTAAAWLPEQ